ncbi:hypothetical protein PUNSTDRAFT_140538 [Punctularia strigosozonata HHB-11173 SS5]|uniref:uncharacterized protein n=1 Tax=Punctularia strigosozonata (strain HHB-11173) TaxID=741275 RepID=UPI00044185BE|nr:uncharacterized protein PUNSTDRAFT_140538 [Punctularia strigosozonata HHB-11173 SS5]EIN14193.1 hypothetical protein PUNSTDRAFT_140538 [Punctularia strigosozonata HHB-11173 SS5]
MVSTPPCPLSPMSSRCGWRTCKLSPPESRKPPEASRNSDCFPSIPFRLSLSVPATSDGVSPAERERQTAWRVPQTHRRRPRREAERTWLAQKDACQSFLAGFEPASGRRRQHARRHSCLHSCAHARHSDDSQDVSTTYSSGHAVRPPCALASRSCVPPRSQPRPRYLGRGLTTHIVRVRTQPQRELRQPDVAHHIRLLALLSIAISLAYPHLCRQEATAAHASRQRGRARRSFHPPPNAHPPRSARARHPVQPGIAHPGPVVEDAWHTLKDAPRHTREDAPGASAGQCPMPSPSPKRRNVHPPRAAQACRYVRPGIARQRAARSRNGSAVPREVCQQRDARLQPPPPRRGTFNFYHYCRDVCHPHAARRRRRRRRRQRQQR